MEGLPMQATCPFTPLAGMVPEPPYNRRRQMEHTGVSAR